DVLGQILKELRAQGALLPLSETCKQLRHKCLPLLFAAVELEVWVPTDDSITLIIHFTDTDVFDVDFFPRDFAASSLQRMLSYTDDPLLCGVPSDRLLATALRSMPHLCTVTLVFPDSPDEGGLPWSLLQAILTLPGLNSFSCDGCLLDPRPAPPPVPLTTSSPLRSFQYSPDIYRHRSRTFQREEDALVLIMQAYHSSLEHLALSSGKASLQSMASLSWPSLRELRLDGELCDSASPMLLVLGNMPKLRVLHLNFALPHGVTCRPIWPKDLPILACPWPDLERLQISFPRVDDELYTRLNPALRSLSLRYFPHLITHSWQRLPRFWQFLPSPCRNFFRILYSSRLPELEELELEYHDDGHEESLLQYLGVAFPKLRSLKILRYRQPGMAEFHIVSLYDGWFDPSRRLHEPCRRHGDVI
ncbi:hypothetical protein BD414DRAFT_422984, partial [Trametes punicea]